MSFRSYPYKKNDGAHFLGSTDLIFEMRDDADSLPEYLNLGSPYMVRRVMPEFAEPVASSL